MIYKQTKQDINGNITEDKSVLVVGLKDSEWHFVIHWKPFKIQFVEFCGC